MSLNFMKIQKGINFAPQASAPSSPTNGDVYYNSTTNLFQFYQNGTFKGLGTGDLLANGTVPLTANWNAGAFQITANSVQVGSAANTISQLSTIINTGTLTLPTSTDTLVGRATTDTLSGKTFAQALLADANNTRDIGSTGTRWANLWLAGNATITGNVSATGTLAGSNFSGTSSGTNTGDVTLAAFGSTPNANGLSLSGQVLNMQPADGTNPGGVSTTTQTIAGLKTFTSAVTGNSFIPTSSTVPVNGMYLSGTNTVAFSTNTTLAGSINASQLWTIGASGGTQTHAVNGSLSVTGIGSYGGATNTSIGLNLTSGSTGLATGSTQLGIVSQMLAGSGATTEYDSFYSQINTQAASFTIPIASNYRAVASVIGAGATITNLAALYMTPPTSGTNNAVLADNASWTGNWVVNSTSANPSYFAGQMRIGTTTALVTTESLDVASDPASNALSIGASIWGRNSFNGAVSQQILGTDSETQRTITTSQTDTGAFSAVFTRNRIVVPTGQTMTNTGILYGVRAGTVNLSGGGTLAATNIYKIGIDADSGAHGTTKIGVFIGNQTGNTNNAAIADNNAFSGTYFINSTQANPSALGGALTVSGQLIAKGTATNDSAAAGNIGEWIQSSVQGQNMGTSGSYSNVTSISLTAGDWDVSALVDVDANGSTTGSVQVQMAISTNTGNTTTDHVTGDNVTSFLGPGSGTSGLTNSRSGAIPSYRMSLSTTTTVYLKTQETYTVATPLVSARISARRAR